jgi:putative endonuclease
MEPGYVYMLTNDRLNVVYVGSTNDLHKRLVHHKRRHVPGFTKKYNVHRLMWFERLPDMNAARCREHQLKGLSRAKKEALIQAANPARRDLFDDVRRPTEL